MKKRWFILGLAAMARLAVPAEGDLKLAINVGQGRIDIGFKGKPLLVYAFATNQFKPYVRELYTLSGENVLRDSPPDHLHHHGLMYAIRVNGVNFWEERDAPGIEKPVKLLRHSMGKSATGLPEANFTQLIHWLAFTNRDAADSAAVALLVEQRTLTLTVNEATGEVALAWDAQFQVGPAGQVTLQGTDYNGLGLRLPQSFDHLAVFQNPQNAPYIGANTRDNIRAEWTAVTGQTARGEITVALFGRPTNPGGDAVFFTLLDPFAYLAATQGLNQKPLEYGAGDRFHLSYLLAIYNPSKPAAFLKQRYGTWAKTGR